MKTFKKFLVEATDASTYFEGVISVCLSMSGYSQKRFKDNILKQKEVKQFLKAAGKEWAVAGKKKTEQQDILWKFAKLCKSKLPATSSDAGFGQSKVKVSEFWNEGTGKNLDTSKADIKVGKFQVSVKGPKAQLMSGEKKETRVTVLSAMKYSGVGGKITKNLLAEVDKFVTSTRTVGEELNGRILKKMSVKDVKEFDKKLLAKGKIDRLKDGNASAKKIIDAQEKMKADIKATFLKAFRNPKVGAAFAYEAMTGWEKFGGNTYPKKKAGDKSGQATHMVIWDYSMEKLRWQKMTPKYAGTIAGKMNIAPDLKSNSYSAIVNGKKQKLGYSFYQSLRISVDAVFKKQDGLQESFYYDMEEQYRLLSEGLIDLDKIKEWFTKAWNKFKEGLTKIWTWLIDSIIELRNAAVEIIEDGIESALNLFELDVDVKVNSEVSL